MTKIWYGMFILLCGLLGLFFLDFGSSAGILVGVGISYVIIGFFEKSPAFEFPKTIHGVPMVEILQGYRVYSSSKRKPNMPASDTFVIFEDGSDVTIISNLRVSKGTSELYVLDSKGKQVFPGTK